MSVDVGFVKFVVGMIGFLRLHFSLIITLRQWNFHVQGSWFFSSKQKNARTLVSSSWRQACEFLSAKTPVSNCLRLCYFNLVVMFFLSKKTTFPPSPLPPQNQISIHTHTTSLSELSSFKVPTLLPRNHDRAQSYRQVNQPKSCFRVYSSFIRNFVVTQCNFCYCQFISKSLIQLRLSPENRKLYMKNDFSCVLDAAASQGAIYISNLPTAQSPSFLKTHNIVSVISAAKGANLSISLPHIQDHLLLPAKDHPLYDISQHFKLSSEFIEKGRSAGNVLVHCMAGISRSATIVAAYLMQKYFITAEEAINQLSSKRKIVNPNSGFRQQLKQLEKQIKTPKNEDSEDKENIYGRIENIYGRISTDKICQKQRNSQDYGQGQLVFQSIMSCSLKPTDIKKERRISFQQSTSVSLKSKTLQKIEKVKANLVSKMSKNSAKPLQEFANLLSSNIYCNKLRIR